MLLSASAGTILPGPKRNDEMEPRLAEILQRPHAVIVDLGVSQVFRPGDFQGDKPCGTPPYMAPEVWSGVMTPQADMFSLGVMLFKLFSNRLPFDVPMECRPAMAFWSLKPSAFWLGLGQVPPQGVFLAQLLLQHDRRKRPSAGTCLHHQFLCAPREGIMMQTERGLAVDISVPQLPSHYAERLANYAGRCILEKSVRVHLASTWSPNQMPTMKQLFDSLDVSGWGRIDMHLLGEILEKSGIDPKRAQAATDASVWGAGGFVGWTEFVAAAVDIGEDRFIPYLQKLFTEADKDSDGLLSDFDLACMMRLDPGDETDVLIAEQALGEIIGSRADERCRVDWHGFWACFKTKPGETDPVVNPEPAVAEEASVTFEKLPRHNPTLLEQMHGVLDWFIQGPAEKADADKLEKLARMGYSDEDRCSAALRRHRNVISESLISELS